jgi:hypothetical protein
MGRVVVLGNQRLGTANVQLYDGAMGLRMLNVAWRSQIRMTHRGAIPDAGSSHESVVWQLPSSPADNTLAWVSLGQERTLRSDNGATNGRDSAGDARIQPPQACG